MRLSADPTGEIDELVEALESAHSPWQKVKVLAKKWQTVRKLRPDERLLVAKHVGLEGAEVFLDKLGDPYRGLPTDVLLDIVRAAEAEDFERWKGIVSRLRRPEEREALLRKGLGQAKEALLEEPVEPAEPEPLAAETIEETPPRLPPVVPEEPVEEVETAPESEPEMQTAAEQEERIEEPPWEAEEEKVEPEERVELPAVEIEPIEVEPAPEAASLLARLTASDTVLSRLRRFTLLREDMRQLETSTLQQLLESLPPGWARRRALIRLFEAGIPEDLQDGLFLIDRQERRTDRLWCLGALVDSRALTQDEKEMVLGRVDSPVVRRRLEIRLGR